MTYEKLTTVITQNVKLFFYEGILQLFPPLYDMWISTFFKDERNIEYYNKFIIFVKIE